MSLSAVSIQVLGGLFAVAGLVLVACWARVWSGKSTARGLAEQGEEVPRWLKERIEGGRGFLGWGVGLLVLGTAVLALVWARSVLLPVEVEVQAIDERVVAPFVAIGLVALALAVWGCRFDSSKGRARCPRCWYDLTTARRIANSTGVRGNCSECGLHIGQDRDYFHPRANRWLQFAPVCSLVVMYAVYVVPRVYLYGWIGTIPTTALILGIGSLPDEVVVERGQVVGMNVGTYGHNLWERYKAGELWEWQKSLVKWRAIKVLESPGSIEEAWAFVNRKDFVRFDELGPVVLDALVSLDVDKIDKADQIVEAWHARGVVMERVQTLAGREAEVIGVQKDRTGLTNRWWLLSLCGPEIEQYSQDLKDFHQVATTGMSNREEWRLTILRLSEFSPTAREILVKRYLACADPRAVDIVEELRAHGLQDLAEVQQERAILWAQIRDSSLEAGARLDAALKLAAFGRCQTIRVEMEILLASSLGWNWEQQREFSQLIHITMVRADDTAEEVEDMNKGRAPHESSTGN